MEVGAFQGGLCYYCLTRSNLCESPRQSRGFTCDNQLSEDSGYFWSNNYISNETSYLHVIDDLHAMGLEDGAYIGVGPNQNFTYIAAVRPRLAFIVDIRRQNLIEHLIFKVLMSSSETREDYLARLLARPISSNLGAAASIADVVANIESTASATSSKGSSSRASECCSSSSSHPRESTALSATPPARGWSRTAKGDKEPPMPRKSKKPVRKQTHSPTGKVVGQVGQILLPMIAGIAATKGI